MARFRSARGRCYPRPMSDQTSAMRPRRLRLAPEWECWPTWDHETGDNLDPASLGLPDGIVARINDWDAAFQAIYDRDDPLTSCFPSREAEATYLAEGRAIAGELAARLPPGTLIVRLAGLDA